MDCPDPDSVLKKISLIMTVPSSLMELYEKERSFLAARGFGI